MGSFHSTDELHPRTVFIILRNSKAVKTKFTANSDKYISAESFDLIFSKIDKLMVNMGDTVRSGKFTSTATDGTSIKACAYCDFAPICRSSNKEHKTAESYSNSEVIDILKRGEEGGI